jgi:hypothetical protein
MTGIEITCLQSFLDHGHDLDVYSYGACSAPAHFNVRDAAEIVPQGRLFFYKSGFGTGSAAGFTNYFRYMLLEQRDTMWIDSDVLCLTNAWPSSAAPVTAAWEDSGKINGAVLRLDREIASLFRQEAEKLGEDILWGESGPVLLTRLLTELDLTTHVFGPEAFYPVHYREWYKPFMSEHTSEVANSCGRSATIHLWNSMLRHTQVDKSLLPDADSFLGEIVLRHCTERYFTPCDKPTYRAHLAVCRDVPLPG